MSQQQEPEQEREAKSRRDFLKSLGKWSAIIIGCTALGGLMAPDESAGWVNGVVAGSTGEAVGLTRTVVGSMVVAVALPG